MKQLVHKIMGVDGVASVTPLGNSIIVLCKNKCGAHITVDEEMPGTFVVAPMFDHAIQWGIGGIDHNHGGQTDTDVIEKIVRIATE